MTPLLDVRNVSKFYGKRIGCKDVSFDLFPGEVMGIVGESGSGKSTLLNLIAGFEDPASGSICINGNDMIGRPPAQRPVSMALSVTTQMAMLQSLPPPRRQQQAAPEVRP